MLRSVKDLRGYTISAIDGDIGQVHEFFFDDRSWAIRYLVVDTGNWLPGRQVLITPFALGQPDWAAQILPVELSKEQVENSPPVSLDKPVSRQMEADLHVYYGWRPYWFGGAGAILSAIEAQAKRKASGEQLDDPHLRSTREVIGYHIQATDGEIGHVEDLIASDEHWAIHYLVIDTRNWLPGRKVLVAPAWVEKVDWVGRQVHVDLTQETLKHSPEFDPSAPVNREYEIRLFDYYGRPKFWA
jgi:hypothetical protein